MATATVKNHVDNVSSTFREFNRADPRLDRDKQPSRILQSLYKGYKETDPPEQHQKAIPLSVIDKIHQSSKSELDRAISNLCTGAIFFCMRSCEYTKVPDQEDRKTKLLCVKNFRFFDDAYNIIDHNDPNLQHAKMVAITFEDQKNRVKSDTVTNHRSGHQYLCPVIAWLKTIKRILSYPGSTGDTPINSFMLEGSNKISSITSKNILLVLRITVRQMQHLNLGFTEHEIGTHSIRSGGAMLMTLADIREFVIKIQGRWKSNSYEKYIRKQIAQFSCELTNRMIQWNHFHHIPKFVDIGDKAGRSG